MKKDIHPKVFNATITCACGNQEQVLSTKGEEVPVSYTHLTLPTTPYV